MNQSAIDPIVQVALIQLPPAAAFTRFTGRFGEWWPRDYTFSKGVLERICFGKAVGEWCYEQGPKGFRCDWGRILEWAPPHLLAFTWQIGPKSVPQPDPSLCSEVGVEFSEESPGVSRVVLTHRGFERHGADGVGYRAEMASDYGWPLLLSAFAAETRD